MQLAKQEQLAKFQPFLKTSIFWTVEATLIKKYINGFIYILKPKFANSTDFFKKCVFEKCKWRNNIIFQKKTSYYLVVFRPAIHNIMGSMIQAVEMKTILGGGMGGGVGDYQLCNIVGHHGNFLIPKRLKRLEKRNISRRQVM